MKLFPMQAVPYGDVREPFQRKCAFDVGDYGLGVRALGFRAQGLKPI